MPFDENAEIDPLLHQKQKSKAIQKANLQVKNKRKSFEILTQTMNTNPVQNGNHRGILTQLLYPPLISEESFSPPKIENKQQFPYFTENNLPQISAYPPQILAARQTNNHEKQKIESQENVNKQIKNKENQDNVNKQIENKENEQNGILTQNFHNVQNNSFQIQTNKTNVSNFDVMGLLMKQQVHYQKQEDEAWERRQKRREENNRKFQELLLKNFKN